MHDRIILKCVIEFMDMWYKKLLFDVRVVKDGVVEVCWDKRSDIIRTGRKSSSITTSVFRTLSNILGWNSAKIVNS